MKTGSAKLARRYAKAMVVLCDQQGNGDVVRKDLQTLANVLDVTPEGAAFLANPTQALAARKTVLGSLLDQTGIQGSARNLAFLLLEKGRIGELAAISGEFATMLDARSGRVQADVAAATPLSTDATTKLQATLQKLLAREVQMNVTVDADLIGGLVVRVGNTVYDASVRNHLNNLRHRLVLS